MICMARIFGAPLWWPCASSARRESHAHLRLKEAIQATEQQTRQDEVRRVTKRNRVKNLATTRSIVEASTRLRHRRRNERR